MRRNYISEAIHVHVPAAHKAVRVTYGSNCLQLQRVFVSWDTLGAPVVAAKGARGARVGGVVSVCSLVRGCISAYALVYDSVSHRCSGA